MFVFSYGANNRERLTRRISAKLVDRGFTAAAAARTVRSFEYHAARIPGTVRVFGGRSSTWANRHTASLLRTNRHGDFTVGLLVGLHGLSEAQRQHVLDALDCCEGAPRGNADDPSRRYAYERVEENLPVRLWRNRTLEPAHVKPVTYYRMTRQNIVDNLDRDPRFSETYLDQVREIVRDARRLAGQSDAEAAREVKLARRYFTSDHSFRGGPEGDVVL